jgi:hypothetical protein
MPPLNVEMGALCSQRVTASAAHSTFRSITQERVARLISYFCGIAGCVGGGPYRFQAQSDIQYGHQADILDFVFWTVTDRFQISVALRGGLGEVPYQFRVLQK